MKHAKRLFGILLALTLALACALPAFAETITLKGRHDTGSTYHAYQLMTAEYDKDASDKNHEAGDERDVYLYHLNSKYMKAIVTGINAVQGMKTDSKPFNVKDVTLPDTTTTDFTDYTVPADLEAAILEYLKVLNANQIRVFADAVYGVIADEIDEETAEAKLGPVKEGDEDKDITITVDGGYYLIVETIKKENESAVTSLVMLDTAGNPNVDIFTKENAPESNKKVKDINDTEDAAVGGDEAWQDSADWDIGDKVPFKLTGKLPANYENYKTYYLAFHDVECDGLTFDPASVVVKIDGNEVSSDKYTVITKDSVDAEGKKLIQDDCTFEVVFENLKTVTPAAGNKSVITVEYESELNDKANIGFTGNENVMHMEFSNNPYYEGEGKPDDTSRTPDDTVIVFTFEADINKIDGNKNPLTGAGFTLYKQYLERQDAADEEIKDETGSVVGYWHEVGVMSNLDGDTTKFYSKGLDDGKYKLVETTVPAGYNKADDIFFKVEAEHVKTADHPTLESLTVTEYEDEDFKTSKGTWVDAKRVEAGKPDNNIQGTFGTNVMNLTGAQLPSTGGMGTTLFYIVGGVLVAAAVILLVTKKRVNSNDK